MLCTVKMYSSYRVNYGTTSTFAMFAGPCSTGIKLECINLNTDINLASIRFTFSCRLSSHMPVLYGHDFFFIYKHLGEGCSNAFE